MPSVSSRWILSVAFVLAAGCGDDAGPQWQAVHRDRPGALMSVWAGAPDDVWAVGADAGDGPEVLRYDGDVWHREATGADGDLWWVHGFPGGPVFLGGEGGLILRWDGTAFTPMTTPGTQTVFGMWGTSPTDMWAVGGNLGGASGAFAWRLDGDAWVEVEGFPAELAATDAVWKVWGRSATDVWFVGTNGLILHHDGNQFAREDAGTSVGLFTVHGTADRVVAVGGFGTGVILVRDADGWTVASPDGAPGLIGVYETAGDGYAVGSDGAVYHRAEGSEAWELEPTETGVYVSLHAVCTDDDGGVWVAGGQLLSAPFTSGVLLHKGDEISGELQ